MYTVWISSDCSILSFTTLSASQGPHLRWRFKICRADVWFFMKGNLFRRILLPVLLAKHHDQLLSGSSVLRTIVKGIFLTSRATIPKHFNNLFDLIPWIITQVRSRAGEASNDKDILLIGRLFWRIELATELPPRRYACWPIRCQAHPWALSSWGSRPTRILFKHSRCNNIANGSILPRRRWPGPIHCWWCSIYVASSSSCFPITQSSRIAAQLWWNCGRLSESLRISSNRSPAPSLYEGSIGASKSPLLQSGQQKGQFQPRLDGEQSPANIRWGEQQYSWGSICYQSRTFPSKFHSRCLREPYRDFFPQRCIFAFY